MVRYAIVGVSHPPYGCKCLQEFPGLTRCRFEDHWLRTGSLEVSMKFLQAMKDIRRRSRPWLVHRLDSVGIFLDEVLYFRALKREHDDVKKALKAARSSLKKSATLARVNSVAPGTAGSIEDHVDDFEVLQSEEELVATALGVLDEGELLVPPSPHEGVKVVDEREQARLPARNVTEAATIDRLKRWWSAPSKILDSVDRVEHITTEIEDRDIVNRVEDTADAVEDVSGRLATMIDKLNNGIDWLSNAGTAAINYGSRLKSFVSAKVTGLLGISMEVLGVLMLLSQVLCLFYLLPFHKALAACLLVIPIFIMIFSRFTFALDLFSWVKERLFATEPCIPRRDPNCPPGHLLIADGEESVDDSDSDEEIVNIPEAALVDVSLEELTDMAEKKCDEDGSEISVGAYPWQGELMSDSVWKVFSKHLDKFPTSTVLCLLLCGLVGKGMGQSFSKILLISLISLPKMKAGLKSAGDASGYVFSILPKSITTFLEDVLPSVSRMNFTDKFRERLTRAHSLLVEVEANPPKNLASVDMCGCLINTLGTLDRLWVKELTDAALTKADTDVFHKLYARLNKFRPAAIATIDQGSCRRVPIGLWLKGPPGIGKTSCIADFAIDLFQTEKDVLVYSRNMKSAHWDGYFGQPVVLYDDAGAVALTSTDDPVPDLLAVMSDQVYYPTFASVDNPAVGIKGTRFDSKMIVCTTNVAFDAVCSNLREKGALRRRFPFFYECSADLRYCKIVDGTIVFNDGYDPATMKHLVFTSVATKKKESYIQVCAKLRVALDLADRQYHEKLDKLKSKLLAVNIPEAARGGYLSSRRSKCVSGMSLEEKAHAQAAARLVSSRLKKRTPLPRTVSDSATLGAVGYPSSQIVKDAEKLKLNPVRLAWFRSCLDSNDHKFNRLMDECDEAMIVGTTDKINWLFDKYHLAVDSESENEFHACNEFPRPCYEIPPKLEPFEWDEDLHKQIVDEQLEDFLHEKRMKARHTYKGKLANCNSSLMRLWFHLRYGINWTMLLSALATITTLYASYRAISSIASGVYNMFSTQPEGASYDGGRRAHRVDVRTVHNLPSRGGNAVNHAEGIEDDECPLDRMNDHKLVQKVKNNIAHFDAGAHEVDVLFLSGRLALMPRHILYTKDGMIRNGHVIHLVIRGVDFVTKYHSDNLIDLVEGGDMLDMCVYKFPPGIPSCPSIVGLFAGEEFVLSSGLLLRNVVLAGVGDTSKTVGMARVNTVKDLYKPFPSMTQVLSLHNRYLYDRVSPGDCGRPLIRVPKTAGDSNIVLGIHLSRRSQGGKWKGCSGIVTRELLKKVIANIPAFNRPEMKEIGLMHNIVRPSEQDFVKGKFTPLGELIPEERSGYFGATAYVPSVIHKKTEFLKNCVYAPSPLSNTDPRMDHPHRLLEEGVSKYATSSEEFDPRRVELVAADTFDEINEFKPQRKPHVWRPEEVVRANELLPNMTGLDFGRSPGIPYQKRAPSGSNHKGKRFLFTDTINGVVIDKRLLKDILDKEKYARSGVMYLDVWKDCLKDELRTEAKIKAGKPRHFTISPVDYVILFRMYCADFVNHIHGIYPGFASAIGMTVYGTEWNDMIEWLKEMSPVGFAGDYSKWDSKCSSQLMMATMEMVNLWYKTHSDSWDEKDDQVRLLLMEEMIHTPECYDNKVVMKHGGMPSGSPFTSIGNTLVNIMYFKLAFMELVPGPMPMKTFSENVRMKLYGDDNLVAVRPELEAVFNAKAYGEWCAGYNMTYTPPDKLGDNSAKLKPLEELDFLKCKSRRVNYPLLPCIRYMPVTSDDALRKTLNWIKKSDDPYECTKGNCEDTLRRAYFAGEDVFAKFHSNIEEACEKAGVTMKLPSFRSCHGTFVYNGFSLGAHQGDIYPTQFLVVHQPVVNVCEAMGMAGKGVSFDRVLNSGSTAQEKHEGVTDENALCLLKEPEWQYKDLVERFQQKDVIMWTTAQEAGTVLARYRVPWDLISSQVTLTAFQRYTFWRGGVSVMFQPTTTRFMQGCLIAYYVPLTSIEEIEEWQVKSSVSQTVCKHVFIDGSSADSREIKLPFVHWKQWLSIRDHDDEDYLGYVIVQVFNVLRTRSGQEQIPVVVFSAFNNAKFRVVATDETPFTPTSNVVDVSSSRMPSRSAKMAAKNRVEGNHVSSSKTSNYNIDSVVASTLGSGNTGDEYDQTLTTKLAASVSPNVAVGGEGNTQKSKSTATVGDSDEPERVRGKDKPEVGTAPFEMLRKPLPYLGHATQIDFSDFMGLYPGSEAKISHSHFMTKIDEMRMDYLMSIATRARVLTWSTSHAQGHILAEGWLAPGGSLQNVKVDGALHEITMLDYVTAPFSFWRGRMNYRFDVIASQIHQGKLVFSTHIGRYATPQDYMERIAQYMHVMDISNGNRSNEVHVDYHAATNFLRTYNGPGTPEELWVMGRWSLSVMNPLVVMDSIALDVDINLFEYSDNMEVSFIGGGNQSLVPVVNVPEMSDATGGGEEEETSGTELVNAQEPDTQTNEVGIGGSFGCKPQRFERKYTTVRDLMKRYTLGGIVHGVDPTVPTVTISAAQCLNPTPAAGSHPNIRNGLIGWYSPMYRVWRGNLRYKFVFDANLAGRTAVTYSTYPFQSSTTRAGFFPKGDIIETCSLWTAIDIANGTAPFNEVTTPFATQFNILKIPRSSEDLEKVQYSNGTLELYTNTEDDYSIRMWSAFSDETRLGLLVGVPFVKCVGIGGHAIQPDTYIASDTVTVPEHIVINFGQVNEEPVPGGLIDNIVGSVDRSQVDLVGGAALVEVLRIDASEASATSLRALGYLVFENRENLVITEGETVVFNYVTSPTAVPETLIIGGNLPARTASYRGLLKEGAQVVSTVESLNSGYGFENGGHLCIYGECAYTDFDPSQDVISIAGSKMWFRYFLDSGFRTIDLTGPFTDDESCAVSVQFGREMINLDLETRRLVLLDYDSFSFDGVLARPAPPPEVNPLF